MVTPMSSFIISVDAALAAHSFSAFICTLLGLTGVLIVAWIFDRQLRQRTGAGYASTGQLLSIGIFAAAVNFAFRLVAPQYLDLGLVLAAVVPAAITFALNRGVHRTPVLGTGLVAQAVLAAVAYMLSWEFVIWAVGLWVAFSILGHSSSEEPVSLRKRYLQRRQKEFLEGRYDEAG